MPRELTRRGLTLSQMMKGVAFSAAVLGCVAPVGRSRFMTDWHAVPLVVAFEMIVVPLALAGVGFLVLRPGVFRVWFLAASVFVALGSAFLELALGLGIVIFWIQPWRQQSRGESLAAYGITIGFDLLLGLTLVFLGRFVVPERCPECGRRRLFRVSQPLALGELGPKQARCVACGSVFKKEKSGWVKWGENEISLDEGEDSSAAQKEKCSDIDP